MKSNRSLALSNRLRECQTANILGCLAMVYPEKEVLQIEEEIDSTKKSRNRVFSANDTLLTMVLTASQNDKTLKNSVLLYNSIHEEKRKKEFENIQNKKQQKLELEKLNGKKSKGRPPKYQLPKSLENSISVNTAAFSKARKRISQKMVDKLFQSSIVKQVKNSYSHWHGYSLYISDGTYIQLQDTKELREMYEVKHKGEPSPEYPKGLLQILINRGSGQLTDYTLSNRHKSELELFHEMLDRIEPESLILLDDLYNCYEIMAKCHEKKIKIVLPAKRERKYKIKEIIENGDEIIEIKNPNSQAAWLKDEKTKEKSLIIRKISCISPEGKEYILNTNVLDKNIKKEEIQALYFSRWDVEIGIREIKTIMDINILRSKTPEMIKKELAISLATYNLIRKIIYESVKDFDFFPKTDLIQEFYSFGKSVHLDKKNRVYQRWSTGRRGFKENDKKRIITKTPTRS